MRAQTSKRHHDQRYGGERPWGMSRPSAAPMYLGWSHANRRMEMMDLASYLDSYRLGYEQAVGDLQSRWDEMAGSMYGLAGSRPRGYRDHGGRPHDEHDRYDRDECEQCGHKRGCCDDDDCECECCISSDADVVIYARCGEQRVIPIEIDNDTRRDRDGVTFEVSDPRTSGGRRLPWKVVLDRNEPVTLAACSRMIVELTVSVVCGQRDGDDVANEPKGSGRTKPADKPKGGDQSAPTRTLDVDRCEVGYVTVRVNGCLLRPIVVAIAVLPSRCGAYHASCSCSCCC